MKDALGARPSGKNKPRLMPNEHLTTFLQEPLSIQEGENKIQPDHEGSPATMLRFIGMKSEWVSLCHCHPSEKRGRSQPFWKVLWKS